MTSALNPRRAGVLLHPTSLPGPDGAGDLGAAAHAFVRWLAEAGCRSWQVLPLVPPDEGGSPYASSSAFALSPWLISLDTLVAQGLLSAAEVAARPLADHATVDYPALRAHKAPLLRRAAARLDAQHPLAAAFEDYVCREVGWLEDFALFELLSDLHRRLPWWQWPVEQRDRAPEALQALREAHAQALHHTRAIQFFADRQWQALRDEAAARDIEIIGDLPIYVGANSADVWAHRALFELDERGDRVEVAGVPPDAFSEVGQLWGNPLYDWVHSAQTDHAWWAARLGRALRQFDRVRIDHFRALSAYWAVPAEAADARSGRWRAGPGLDFLQTLHRALAPELPLLPVIAEDLGILDEGVYTLMRESGLPGMHVLHFAFGGGSDNHYLPHNHRKNGLVYPGTHDNDTTLGWWFASDEATRDHVRRYFSCGDHDIVWEILRAALASVCDTAILAAQDLLALDGHARMNVPGRAEGNWGWRLPSLPIHPEITGRLRTLIQLYGRGAEP